MACADARLDDFVGLLLAALSGLRDHLGQAVAHIQRQGSEVLGASCHGAMT